MNIRPEHLDALRDLGYTDTEASFLYLVATHSGYFTQRQFLAFAQVQKGGLASRLIAKALECKHLRAAQGAYHTHVYNLYSRRLYDAIDRENLRNRRRHSKELIQTRLLILDFVLAHPDERYLETEAEKVAYFHDTLGLALSCLPSRIYKGSRSNSVTKRYFIDRYPVLLLDTNSFLFLPSLLSPAATGRTRASHGTLLTFAATRSSCGDCPPSTSSTLLPIRRNFVGPLHSFVACSAMKARLTPAILCVTSSFGCCGRRTGRAC